MRRISLIPKIPPPSSAPQYGDWGTENPVRISPGSIEGKELHVVFGTVNKVPCYNIASERDGNNLFCHWAVCYGEQSGINGFRFGRNSDYVTTGNFDFVIETDLKVGAINQTVSSVMNEVSGYIDTYPSVTNVSAKMNTAEMDALPSFDVFASVNGFKVADLSSVESASTRSNPVYQAIFILTGNYPYRQIAPIAAINESSFQDGADYCDSVMSDSEPRYTSNLYFVPSDGIDDARKILKSCHMDIGVGDDNKLYLINHNTAKTSQAIITLDDMVGVPEISERKRDQVYNEVEVAFVDKDDVERSVFCNTYPAETPTVFRRIFVTGITRESEACRYGHTFLRLSRERIELKAIIGPVMSDVKIGDVVTIHCPYGYGEKEFRLMEKVSLFHESRYICKFQEYNGKAGVDFTISSDSTPSSAELNVGTPNPVASFTAGVSTADTGRDTSGPIINASFSPPEGGPRVRNYEIQDSTGNIIYRGGPGDLSVSFFPATLGSYKITIYAVGYNGVRSTGIKSGTLNCNRGEVTGIQTVPVSAMADTDGASLVYDETSGAYKPLKDDLIVTMASDYISASASQKTVEPDIDGTIRAVSVVAYGDVEADQGPLRVEWESVSPSTITVKRAVGASQTYILPFYCIVLIDRSTIAMSGGGTGTPPATS
jgi:hypothetical protein